MTSLIIIGMKHGSENVVDRMGADIIVVPKNYGNEIEGMLLTTQKSYFYMNDSIVDKIKSIDGIDKISTQTFLMTLDASCCDQSAQIIGIDIDTDFTVTPWMDKKFINSLDEGEIIAGDRVAVRENKTFKMFGDSYKVSAILDESGSMMDNTVFVSRKNMPVMIDKARKAGQGIVKEVGADDISAVLISVIDKSQIQQIVGKLSSIDGIDIVTTDMVSSKLSSGLKEMSTVYILIIALIVVVSILLLYFIYYITLNERKSEIEILRTIGISRRKVKRFLISEISIISFAGACLGVILGFVFYVVLYQIIKNTNKIPL
ncbi:MAG TPA: hypothetical protein DCW44_09010, partial [Eubacterium sp.]|nr:hypothetical protein [Eubacterium sp.]